MSDQWVLQAKSSYRLAALFYLVDFELELRDPLELNLQIVAHLIQDITADMQRINDVVEFFPRHVEPVGLWKTRERRQESASLLNSHGFINSPAYLTAESTDQTDRLTARNRPRAAKSGV